MGTLDGGLVRLVNLRGPLTTPPPTPADKTAPTVAEVEALLLQKARLMAWIASHGGNPYDVARGVS